MPISLPRRIARLAASVGLIAVITAVCYRLMLVGATTAGFVYLIGVLLIGAKWGIAESIVSSILAMLCFDFFFLPPIGEFEIAQLQDWVALFAFLVTSITATRLAAQAQTRANEAQESKEEWNGCTR